MNHDFRNTQRLPALDGIRILLIFLIIISHCEFLGEVRDPLWAAAYRYLFHNATLAVDFFFMLTGFGIAHSWLQSPARFLELESRHSRIHPGFAWSHIRKLYPVYLLGLLLSVPYSILTMLPFHEGLTFPVAATGVLFTGCLTMLQSLTGTMMLSHALNGVSWYLSSLFVILLLFPEWLRVLGRDDAHFRRTGHSRARLRLFLLYDAVLLLTILFSLLEGRQLLMFTLDDLVYGSPYIRFFYVAIGAEIALLLHQPARRQPALHRRPMLRAFYLVVLLWQFGLRNFTDLALGLPFLFRRVLNVIAAAGLLYGIASESLAVQSENTASRSLLVRFLSAAPLVRCKSLTMYLFLLHFPVRNYVILLFGQNPEPQSVGAALPEAGLILLLSVLCALTARTLLSRLRPSGTATVR